MVFSFHREPQKGNFMITAQGKIPTDITVACSGGVDSMAIANFLQRKHNVKLLFIHHLTKTSDDALKFLQPYTNKNNIDFECRYIRDKKPTKGKENYWREERYRIFYSHKAPIITCHHLDDCVETWIWSSLHGTGKIIPYRHANVIRPFRQNKKEEFVNWCERNDVPWIEDKTNEDTKYMRNFIRHQMMDSVLVVNRGIHKTIRKKILAEDVS